MLKRARSHKGQNLFRNLFEKYIYIKCHGVVISFFNNWYMYKRNQINDEINQFSDVKNCGVCLRIEPESF